VNRMHSSPVHLGREPATRGPASLRLLAPGTRASGTRPQGSADKRRGVTSS